MLDVQRARPHVPAPVWDFMPVNFDSIDISALKLHFLREGRLSIEDATEIVRRAKAVIAEEPNLLRIEEPIVVVGDIHGQFYDLVKLLELGGPIEETVYLFLGDYVDRGCFSCECCLLLFAIKILYPRTTFLLRGNHESRHLTHHFNFKEECLHKYDISVYHAIMLLFDNLPVAALVGEKFFCVHGGLSPDVTYVDDIQHLQRVREVPTSGALCDLLWSDPSWDVENPAPSVTGRNFQYQFGGGTYDTVPSFLENEQRGCSYIFNFASLKHFLTTNKLLCVIRAHEAQDEGFKLYRPHPQTNFPSMLSVFSAPNYCDTYDNKGAIAVIKSGTINIKQFFSSSHPYVLPQFINGFTWSLPFVEEKLLDLLSEISTNRPSAENFTFRQHSLLRSKLAHLGVIAMLLSR